MFDHFSSERGRLNDRSFSSGFWSNDLWAMCAPKLVGPIIAFSESVFAVKNERKLLTPNTHFVIDPPSRLMGKLFCSQHSWLHRYTEID